jgi:hypothetical protein
LPLVSITTACHTFLPGICLPQREHVQGWFASCLSLFFFFAFMVFSVFSAPLGQTSFAHGIGPAFCRASSCARNVGMLGLAFRIVVTQ